MTKPHLGSHVPVPSKAYLAALKIGQRVLAVWEGPGSKRVPLEGVISGEFTGYSIPVQFEPCGCHWHCDRVTCYGNADGWTDEEYRIEREASYCSTRAADVERERRERYPDKPFSIYEGA
jgi:hypothetical protein